MRVITVLAPKGGVGRTATVAALGAAFAAQGWRVLVIDASDDARRCRPGEPGLLEGWRDRVQAHRAHPLSLAAVTARDVGDLLAALDGAATAEASAAGMGVAGTAGGDTAAAQARTAGASSMSARPSDAHASDARPPEVVLIDTAGRTDDRARVALRATDLVLVPFRTALDAFWVRKGLARELPPGLPALAVPCGLSGDPAERAAACAPLGEGPFTRAELPDAADALAWLWAGGLPSHGRGRPARDPRARPMPGGRKARQAVQDTWSHASALAAEVLVAAAPDGAPAWAPAWASEPAERQGLRLMLPPAGLAEATATVTATATAAAPGQGA